MSNHYTAWRRMECKMIIQWVSCDTFIHSCLLHHPSLSGIIIVDWLYIFYVCMDTSFFPLDWFPMSTCDLLMALFLSVFFCELQYKWKKEASSFEKCFKFLLYTQQLCFKREIEPKSFNDDSQKAQMPRFITKSSNHP